MGVTIQPVKAAQSANQALDEVNKEKTVTWHCCPCRNAAHAPSSSVCKRIFRFTNKLFSILKL